jgi:hypothetical protein
MVSYCINVIRGFNSWVCSPLLNALCTCCERFNHIWGEIVLGLVKSLQGRWVVSYVVYSMKFNSCKMAVIRYKFAPKFAVAYLGVCAPYSQVYKFRSLPEDRLFCRTLTFRGPCIVIYSYNKSQRNVLFFKFILIKNSKCFGQIYCPSSGVSTLYTQQ